MKVQNCLLIGNGLNRTLNQNIPWANLLNDLSIELNTDYHKNISFPLEFERIINAFLANSDNPNTGIYTYVKEFVAKKILDVELPDDAIHRRLREIKVNSILTTNYDFLLEDAFNCPRSNISKKYIFEATSSQNGINFYHLHGMASNPKSICLGYEHYAGIVEKLRVELNSKSNNENNKMKIKQILCGEAERKNTWGEKFYTSNIDIIGLSLDLCEMDLWWLITHRAYLYYSNYCGLKEFIKNKITYYDVIDDIRRENSEDEDIRSKNEQLQLQKHILLINNHIEVKTFLLSEYGKYLDIYNLIIEHIKKENN